MVMGQNPLHRVNINSWQGDLHPDHSTILIHLHIEIVWNHQELLSRKEFIDDTPLISFDHGIGIPGWSRMECPKQLNRSRIYSAYMYLPSGYVNNLPLKIAIEIVNFPLSRWFAMAIFLYQRVWFPFWTKTGRFPLHLVFQRLTVSPLFCEHVREQTSFTLHSSTHTGFIMVIVLYILQAVAKLNQLVHTPGSIR